MLDIQITAKVRACTFIFRSCGSSGALASWCRTEHHFCDHIIGSRLDYCNSLYCSISNTNFESLQRVQNAAAQIVCQAPPRQHHSVDLLKDLHWLSVHGRVGYKIAVLCYKAVKLQQPSYRTWLLSPYRQSRVLRSSTSDLLSIFIDKLCCSSVLMLRPTVCNSLPSFVCIADSFTIVFVSAEDLCL